ncbi:hypothetical protein QJS10_CPA06g02474 [Acorus calamus]|uniref:NAD(P)-binding domain-containing protein n=1 Tax=Acorus calamus TaxID=4465 RepID=A0AAV9EPM7_ACOCL|nr:hypothetical protein QJS10_CPA06g02474 [Acorus calamus]
MASSLSSSTLSKFSFNYTPRESQLSIHSKNPSHHIRFRCSSKKKTSFTDQILDYIEEEEEVRDAVLVTNGDSEIGQMVILSLIVKRTRIKALVKDKRAAVEAFGNYVEPIAGDISNKSFVTKALRGVRSIICPSNEGFLSDIGNMKGICHIVLLSQLAAYRGSRGLQALVNSKARNLAERDEAVVIASGIPYTIIQAGLLKDTPGGKQGCSFEEGAAAEGSLSKEDAAFICVAALDVVPQNGFIFEVVNGDETVSDWKERIATLVKVAEQSQ